MKRNSHSWSWSVCMSITAVMTWVIPLGGITPVQRTASASSIPEDDDTPRVSDQIRSSEWFTEVGQPMMEMLGIPENDWIRFLTEFSIESDAHESLPEYGDVFLDSGLTPRSFFQLLEQSILRKPLRILLKIILIQNSAKGLSSFFNSASRQGEYPVS